MKDSFFIVVRLAGVHPGVGGEGGGGSFGGMLNAGLL